MNLDKDGRPKISEAEVIAAIKGMVPHYMFIKTNASDLTRGGRPAHREGTPDFVAIPRQGRGEFRAFFLEAKRRKARTQSARRAKQAATAADLRRDGHAVCVIPDDHPDPIGYFRDWALREGVIR